MSGTLDKIEKNVSTTAKNSTKATESLGDSFTKAQGNILLLGNAAASVDRIFSAYQNTQIRIENATIRLMEAQDDVNRLVREGKTDTDEYVSAQRRLEMAQNNLERANNAVLGTYINMGLQTANLLFSLPMLIAAIPQLALTMKGLAVSMTTVTVAGAPLWAIILAIIAAIGIAILVWKNWDAIVQFFKNTILKAWEILSGLGDFIKNVFIGFVESLKGAWDSLISSLQKVIEWLEKIIDKATSAIKKVGEVAGKAGGAVKKGVGAVGGFIKGGVSAVGGALGFKDFIMRPGQQPISFSPSDTIIGTKNGGAGGNVTINISSNAVGAEEVFRLLMREMKSQGVRI